MIRASGWVAAPADAYLLALSLLVLTLEGVALSGPLVLSVVAGSGGLVVFLCLLHPHPIVALAIAACMPFSR